MRGQGARSQGIREGEAERLGMADKRRHLRGPEHPAPSSQGAALGPELAASAACFGVQRDRAYCPPGCSGLRYLCAFPLPGTRVPHGLSAPSPLPPVAFAAAVLQAQPQSSAAPPPCPRPRARARPRAGPAPPRAGAVPPAHGAEGAREASLPGRACGDARGRSGTRGRPGWLACRAVLVSSEGPFLFPRSVYSLKWVFALEIRLPFGEFGISCFSV